MITKYTYTIRVGRLRELKPFHASPDLLLNIHEETPEKVLKVLFVAEAAEARALLVLLLELVVVRLVARAQVGLRVHEEVVRAVAAQKELAHVVVVVPGRVHLVARCHIAEFAH